MLDVGIVVIGRNEGERLRRCLLSVKSLGVSVVYVDSGSSDGSIEMAESLGAEVISLDPALGFTAAKARNLGWRHLAMQVAPPSLVQFVDGDCEVVNGWLRSAVSYLQEHPSTAGVCGRLRERYPQASIYNALCDLEWNTPVGATLSTGGNAMFHMNALKSVEGYRDSLIAGEEPEMCLRLRSKGWTLYRHSAEMALHDADMRSFTQWWRRSTRAGHAFAEGNFLHGSLPHRHYRREVLRCLVWGAAFPATSAAVAVGFGLSYGLALVVVYPVQVFRLWFRYKKDASIPENLALPLSLAHVMGRFAEFLGFLKFWRGRSMGRRSVLMEHRQ